jgi:hypothetical protein
MVYKKHILPVLFMIGISFSAYAMHEDQLINEDSAVADAITEKYKSLAGTLNDTVSSIFPTGKSDEKLVDGIIEKIKNLNSNFSSRHKSQENFDAFHRDLNDIKNELTLLPDELREKIVTENFGLYEYNLISFLKGKTASPPYEQLTLNYVPELHTIQQSVNDESITNQKLAEEQLKKNSCTMCALVSKNKAISIIAGTAICSAIAGACYYVYKKYWKKEEQNLSNKQIIIHVKKTF